MMECDTNASWITFHNDGETKTLNNGAFVKNDGKLIESKTKQMTHML